MKDFSQTIFKKYRPQLWTKFIKAIKEYKLISANDKIAVCISGGKDSMLMALLFKMLNKITEIPFEIVNLVMDPGYSEKTLQQIKDNANLLDIDITIFNTTIFDIAASQEKSPCYLCARMRRGHLYAKAQELGCNKIALGHHYSDVIETTLMGMLYGAQFQTMMPRIKSTNFKGMELIRPLYFIKEDDIINWQTYNDLKFAACACKFTEQINKPEKENLSKRKEIKNLIKELKKTNPDIEQHIFKSLHNVNLDTIISYKQDGVVHSFLDKFK